MTGSQPTAPTLHIRPSTGWINDPNGMMFHAGRWHVFFQHNPARAQHDDIHWGHVSSSDLVTWHEHPVAFGPTPGGPDRGGCWSGAHLRWAAEPTVVYSGLVSGEGDSTVCARQALDDGLETWSPPTVIAHQPQGIGLRVMRDPAPFEWNRGRFALLGAGMTDGTAALLLFSCANDDAWDFCGVWLRADGVGVRGLPPADVWECPQLLQLPTGTVLFFSIQKAGELNEVIYLVGDLTEDPRSPGLPAFVPRAQGLLDNGPDFYAPQAIRDDQAAPLLFGWVKQDSAPDAAPSDALAGCLTLPRRLSLIADRIAVQPDPAIETLAHNERAVASQERSPHILMSTRSRLHVTVRPPRRLQLTIEGSAGPQPLELPEGECAIWVDGEVAEIFLPTDAATTIRQPGTNQWKVRDIPENATAHLTELEPRYAI